MVTNCRYDFSIYIHELFGVSRHLLHSRPE
ncbi:protein of unknown function [Magnetospirillum sp. XM-1]|nr:protein of unknown function [Magnetospirillum sp. XM-1]